jgi:hypothetical protein
VLAAHLPGTTLIRFYGTLEFAWLPSSALSRYTWHQGPIAGSSPTQKNLQKLALAIRSDAGARHDGAAAALQQVAQRLPVAAEELERVALLACDEVCPLCVL